MRSTMQKVAAHENEHPQGLEPPEGSSLQLLISAFPRVPQKDGPARLVKGLTANWVNMIRNCLRQISEANGEEFDRSLATFLAQGYLLTSLVAELRYDPSADVSNTLRCEIRPKIGARPLLGINAVLGKNTRLTKGKPKTSGRSHARRSARPA